MDRSRTITELMDDTEGVEAALRRGVREALRLHKALGNPVVFCVDGQPVLVAPQDIVIPEEDEESHAPASVQ